MKINSKILSLPPYLSTSWDQVASLSMESNTLIVTLKTNEKVSIPNLPPNILEAVFSAHASSLENKTQSTPEKPKASGMNNAGFSIGLAPGQLGIEGMENFSAMMQHDPTKSDSPPLPPEMLEKIAGVSKALGIDKASGNLPEDQPHCHCPFCQISRAMHGKAEPSRNNSEQEEVISDSELTFKEWEISQLKENLFKVVNPLDENEFYQVFLGNPVGCTCGKDNCEHIVAVLKS